MGFNSGFKGLNTNTFIRDQKGNALPFISTNCYCLFLFYNHLVNNAESYLEIEVPPVVGTNIAVLFDVVELGR